MAAILEAAARLLERQGEAAVTTDAVARLAGCSIGSLYQYFSNRDEILLALVDRERQRMLDKAHELFRGLGSGPQPHATRAFVRALIASFAARRGARRQFELVMTLGMRSGRLGIAERFAEMLASRGAREEGEEERRAGRVRAFVLSRAMLGALRAAALADDDIIEDIAFEDALCLMVETLGSRSGSARGTSAP